MKRKNFLMLLTIVFILMATPLCYAYKVQVMYKQHKHTRPSAPYEQVNNVTVEIDNGEMYITFEKAEGMANIEVTNVDNSLEMSLVSTTTDVINFPLSDYLETGNCTITIETDAGNIYEGQFYLE